MPPSEPTDEMGSDFLNDDDLLMSRIRDVVTVVGDYPLDAFLFVHAGVIHAVRISHGKGLGKLSAAQRHVDGRAVCLGLRDLAWLNWGSLASAVFSAWNIHDTYDFGRIVYALIDAQILSSQPNDSIDDFVRVFEFSSLETEYTLATGFVNEGVRKTEVSVLKGNGKLKAKSAGQSVKPDFSPSVVSPSVVSPSVAPKKKPAG